MSTTYTEGIERLLDAVQALSMAPDLTEVQRIVATTARQLVGCDGVSFVLRDGDLCFYADEDAISPLWKGSRFPMSACISGWVMHNRTPAVIPDIYVDDRIPHDAYRPTFVQSLAMLPVRSLDPIAAIGAYWATEHTATPEELNLLQGLANAASIALDKVDVHRQLDQAVELRALADRRSGTDELTGVLNRRGFHDECRASWGAAPHVSASVAFIDLNGLKQVNDFSGHDAGDELIREAALRLVSSVRETDLVARVGGDEFAVFCLGLNPDDLRLRLTAALGTLASVGTAEVAHLDFLPDALLAADARMYLEKKTTAALRSA
ncbi:diguanylate cyclase domain-containing protein [Nocardioides sp. Bht2]|uniref:GGDEF domain-containing protein n=1 Tax=Nocardioides sp. Bht2 TaxID=3392297 RepID=UPI0039B68384